MRTALSLWLGEHVVLWTSVVLFVVAAGMYFVVPQIPYFDFEPPPEHDVECLLDRDPIRLPGDTYETLEKCGADVRESLRLYYKTVDLLFPLLYTSFFVLAISGLFRRHFDPGRSMQQLNLVPIGAAIFDMIENMSILRIIVVFQKEDVTLGWLASVGTTGKTGFFVASAALVFFGLGMEFWNRFKRE